MGVVDVHVLFRGGRILQRRRILELYETIRGVMDVGVVPVEDPVDPPAEDAVARESRCRFPLEVELDAVPFPREDESRGDVGVEVEIVATPLGLQADPERRPSARIRVEYAGIEVVAGAGAEEERDLAAAGRTARPVGRHLHPPGRVDFLEIRNGHPMHAGLVVPAHVRREGDPQHIGR